MSNEPRWRNLVFSNFQNKNRSDLKPGFVEVSAHSWPGMESDTRQFYSLTYIYDIKHYSVIEYDQDPVHNFSAKEYAEIHEYEEQLATTLAKLWGQADIKFDGKPLQQMENYSKCPAQ